MQNQEVSELQKEMREGTALYLLQTYFSDNSPTIITDAN